MAHPLIPLIETYLQEPPPPRLSEACNNMQPLGSPGSPIGQACVAYARAVQRVATSADRITRDGWRQRRHELAGWLQVLRDTPPLDTPEAVLEDVIVGPRWRECAETVQQMYAWSALVAAETARKAATINDCSAQVRDAFERAHQRMAAIVAAAESRIEASPADRDATIRHAQGEVVGVSQTAVAHIHTQIRTILDLDETLAPISVEDWVSSR